MRISARHADALGDGKTRKGESARKLHKERAMCQHIPTCPTSTDAAREAARVVSSHPEQGWSLLCNGVILFEDTGELLPDLSTVRPHRGCEGKTCHGVSAVPAQNRGAVRPAAFAVHASAA
jgi:hypothetical protein